MSILVSKPGLLIFGAAFSVVRFATVKGPADSLSTLPYDGLESPVLASDSILPFPSGESPGTLATQSSSECEHSPNQHPIRMRSKCGWCPNSFVDPNTALPGQDTRPTSQSDHSSRRPKINGQINQNPKKQP